MPTLADIHDAEAANATSLADIQATLKGQLAGVQTALETMDTDAIRSGCAAFYQTFDVMMQAMTTELTNAQYEHTMLAAIVTGHMVAAVMPDGTVQGDQEAVDEAASTDVMNGQGAPAVAPSMLPATSPAPTGQMPVGTTTGLQPIPGSDVSVPTEGDPVAAAAAAAAGPAPASTAPLANGGAPGVATPPTETPIVTVDNGSVSS